MLRSLAFLLAITSWLLNRGSFSWHCATWQESRTAQEIGKIVVESSTRSRTKDSVGMVDVGSAQILNRRLKGCKSNNNLIERVSTNVRVVGNGVSQKGHVINDILDRSWDCKNISAEMREKLFRSD